MVDIIGTHRLNDFREDSNREFPKAQLSEIKQAVEAVPESVLLESDSGDEATEFDNLVAEHLPEYSTEGSNECVLWAGDGFQHSVDLYHTEERIAIELEKSEKKYVWKDLVKFGRGGCTSNGDRKKVEYGCLVVPDYYLSESRPVFSGTRQTLKFIEPMLDNQGIVIIGFHNPNAT
jgi:hypothetical protein